MGFGKFYSEVVRSGLWARFSPKAQAIYGVLVAHLSGKTGECFPSEKLIAEQANLNVRTIPAGVKELLNWGVISVRRSKHRNNIYRITPSEELNQKYGIGELRSLKSKKNSKRPRGKNGQFLKPSGFLRTSKQILASDIAPSLMDVTSPCEMDNGTPLEMDANRGDKQNNLGQNKTSCRVLKFNKKSKTNDAYSEILNAPRMIPCVENFTLIQIINETGADQAKDKLKQFGINEADIDKAFSVLMKLNPSFFKKRPVSDG